MGIDGEKSVIKIYVKVPFKLKDEQQIKDLHEDIKTVKLPRQKSRNFCFIHFDDVETKKRVVTHLKNLVINNKKVRVKPWKQGKTVLPKPQYQVLTVKGNQSVDDRLNLLKKEEK